MAGHPVLTIVGSGPGVSQAVARRFGREGFRVALLARNEAKLQHLVRSLGEEGIEAKSFLADAANEDSIVRGFDQVESHWGNTEVLLYNAFSSHTGTPSTLSTQDLLLDFTVGVVGAVVALQQVLEPMKAHGSGTLMFTGGGFAITPMAGLFSLGIAKSGLRSLATSVSQELDGTGIKVGTVTICGVVAESGPFAADKIAEAFWTIHASPPGSAVERIYTGDSEFAAT